MEKTDLTLKVIDEYISCAKYMCDALKEQFRVAGQPLLMAYREGKIPKKGTLQNGPGTLFTAAGAISNLMGEL